MNVNYEGKEYKLDVDELDITEATYIKVKTGLSLLAWQAALEQVDPDALKALYWLMMKQNGVAADFERINFKIIKFTTAFRDAQVAEETGKQDPPTVAAAARKDS